MMIKIWVQLIKELDDSYDDIFQDLYAQNGKSGPGSEFVHI